MDRRALSPWCGPGARVAPRWRPDPPRRGGAAWLAALALAAAPAGADTAVVPADHATIQAAVTAVQGTAGALVRIDSNATFTELVTATESVAIEAGAGFTPTLRGTLGSCVGAGGCAINFNPSGAAATSFGLRGLRLLPAAGATSAHQVVQLLNQSSAIATLVAEDLVIEDPGNTGSKAFHVRVGPPGTGPSDATVRDSRIELGGISGVSTTAFSMAEEGTLTLERIDLVMTGGSAQGFNLQGTQGTGIVLVLRDSTFDISAPSGPHPAAVGFLLGETEAAIERNQFLLRGGPQAGTVSGVRMATGGTSSLVLDANQFVGLGGNLGNGVAVDPFGGGTGSVFAMNNVLHGIGRGFDLDPQPGEASASEVEAVLTNNTIHGSQRDGIRIRVQEQTGVSVEAFNNLITGSAEVGIRLTDDGGLLAFSAGFNGFFANAGGDLGAPLASPNSVFASPAYVSSTNLRLGFGSPMLDAGSNSAPALTALDVAGEPRIQNGVVDIGAYEGGFEPVVEVPTVGEWGLTLLAALLAALAMRRVAGG